MNPNTVEEHLNLESAKKLIKDFDKKIRDEYVKDNVAPKIGSPYYYFRGTVMALLNKNALVEDYEETDDFDQIIGHAQIIYITHNMSCPSSRTELWKDRTAKEDFKELIEIVKRILKEERK